MSNPHSETAAALRAKAERCMRVAGFQRQDIRLVLVAMASDYLERAVQLEEKQRKRDK